MNRKTKGVLAGAAGIALLLGGTTFATWSDQANIGGGTITSGNLDVAPVGGSTPVWYDVSSDLADGAALAGPLAAYNGHQVDLASWRIVPGDTAVAAFGFAVALEGENLAAQIGVSGLDAAVENGADVEISVVDRDNVPVTLADGNVLRLRSADAASDLGGTPVVNTSLTGTETTADLTVVVEVTFPTSVVGRDSVQTQVASLPQIGVSLTQLRSGAGFGA